LKPLLRLALAAALAFCGCSAQSSFSVNLGTDGTVACSRDSDVSEHVADIVKAVVPLAGTVRDGGPIEERMSSAPALLGSDALLAQAIEVCRELVNRRWP